MAGTPETDKVEACLYSGLLAGIIVIRTVNRKIRWGNVK
jgi:hypothetical protein